MSEPTIDSPCCDTPMQLEGMVGKGYLLWRCECGKPYVETETSVLPPDMFQEMMERGRSEEAR
jgi:hypothetical protein